MFLSPRGALCRGMPHGYVAYRKFEVNAHEVSSDRPDLSLSRHFGLFGRPASRVSAFRLFGFPAFRLPGFSGKEADNVVGWRARFAVTLNPV